MIRQTSTAHKFCDVELDHRKVHDINPDHRDIRTQANPHSAHLDQGESPTTANIENLNNFAIRYEDRQDNKIVISCPIGLEPDIFPRIIGAESNVDAMLLQILSNLALACMNAGVTGESIDVLLERDIDPIDANTSQAISFIHIVERFCRREASDHPIGVTTLDRNFPRVRVEELN